MPTSNAIRAMGRKTHVRICGSKISSDVILTDFTAITMVARLFIFLKKMIRGLVSFVIRPSSEFVVDSLKQARIKTDELYSHTVRLGFMTK